MLFSATTPQSTWEFLCKRLVPLFLERPEFDPRRCSEWLEEFSGQPFARAGLEGAVWDLRAKENSRPLWSVLGGQLRPVAPGAVIGLMPSTAILLDRVEGFLSEGYQRIKIAIAPGRDLELVQSIRERFGGIPLMVDANASYQLDDWKIFEELDRFELMMIEQPLAREALEEHADLQTRLRTPICLDESADSLISVRSIIRMGSARIININAQRMGGVWPARLAHEAAQKARIPCWLGTMPELGIGAIQGLHLATLPNFIYPTDVAASLCWYEDDIIAPPIEVTGYGFIWLSSRPGMGCCVDREEISLYQIQFEEFRT